MSHVSAMRADTPFSYRCTRCKACCTGKRIQVNPYEIARLARNRGVSTGELRARFTENGALRQDDADTCVFLGKEGCGVHPDRPLVCRLFPLGRTILADGSVSFGEVDRNWARGHFGTDGVVKDYVEAQGAAPFIAAADAYFAWFVRAHDRVGVASGEGVADDSDDLLDIDTQLAGWAAATGQDAPADIDARMRLHLSILDTKLGEDDD
ncbi:YkgJ family cysteine cluster protein [Sphingomonas sp.]|uniref:YkgJ family cysteine cluster protein n=1 Tax=Sphingomonas sp. TaxID=28214 RepID=UPI0025D02CB6|nr:YkgJ family cysteine cluster protein [Sphingomonas sp.]